VAWVIRFVPWILAVVLFIYGWWCARQLAAENRSVENGVNS
jgi:hypothetical protein